jgi:hypothetical protein
MAAFYQKYQFNSGVILRLRRVDSIPASVHYLHVPAERVQLSRAELSGLGLRADKLNVGLLWSSGDWNPERNIDLEELRGLARIGLRLFSLQHGDAAGWTKTTVFPERSAISAHHGGAFGGSARENCLAAAAIFPRIGGGWRSERIVRGTRQCVCFGRAAAAIGNV